MNKNSEALIILKPWDEIVSMKGQDIVVDINLETFNYEISTNKSKNHQGVYAKYDEGVFMFLKYNNRLYIGWQKILVAVDEITKTEWGFSWHSRSFKAFDRAGNIKLQADYHTYKRFIKNPLRLLGEIFTPDDDWGLVADLPSFIDSIIQDNSILASFESILIK